MQKKPNIILFVTDDHGQWANSSYGNTDVYSPALDFLADNGAVMENAFTPTPVCSPSRACIYTGRISSQHGVHDYLGSGGNTGIEDYPWLAEEKLLSEILQEQGYSTGLCGKWHLGNESNPQSGFDFTFTIGTKYPVPHGGKHKYFENGKAASFSGFITDLVTDKSIQFIRKNSDEEKPFFLTVGYTSTHHPWEGQPERLVNMYRKKNVDSLFQNSTYPFGIQNLESTFTTRSNPREALAQYYAAVSHIDEGVGRIIDEIYSSKLDTETLIIYTSDHGLNCGQHGIWGKGNGTLPLNLVEESIRVPMIISYPGQVTSPQRRDELVDHTDLFQTILDFAHVKLDQEFSESKNFPGKSYFHKLVNDIPLKPWRDFQCCEYGDVRMIRNNRYKLIRRYPNGPCEFFDLHLNPEENINYIEHQEYGKIIKDMTVEMDSFYSAYEDEVKSGLNVKKLPIHNSGESWRDPRNLH